MKIVSSFSPYYQKFIKEFIFNIPKDFNKAGSKDYRKVHIRGFGISFSPAIINEYLGRRNLTTADKDPPLKIIARKITGSVYEDRPKKGLLPNTSLSVKYVIMYKIGFSNWAS